MLINNHGFMGSLRLSDMATVSQEEPENTAQPSFAPQPPQEGEEVEVDEGQWGSSTPITYEYQWQLNGVDIVGATAKTLLILVGMAGQSLRCAVKAVNSVGFTIAYTVSVEVVVGVGEA